MSSSDSSKPHECVVAPEEAGLRLDVFLAGEIPDASRSLLKQAIKEECVLVNAKAIRRPSRTVAEGDRITVQLPPQLPSRLEPENIPIDVVFEDSDLLIVNKPSGLVVHPAPGHPNGTLVNAVLYHCKDFQTPSESTPAASVRPGIVHRLDRFTSGLMVIAKSPLAFEGLSRQAREHAFERRYNALIRGEFKEDTGVIRASIGRSLADRKRMSVTAINARDAVTHFAVSARFGSASSVALRLETGRTHQIRLHLRFAGHPVLGDPMYGVTDFENWAVPVTVQEALENLQGQALHAEVLGIKHPRTNAPLRFSAPPPPDFQAAHAALQTLQSQ